MQKLIIKTDSLECLGKLTLVIVVLRCLLLQETAPQVFHVSQQSKGFDEFKFYACFETVISVKLYNCLTYLLLVKMQNNKICLTFDN